MTAGIVQSNNKPVDKRFNQTIFNSRLENNTKENLLNMARNPDI